MKIHTVLGYSEAIYENDFYMILPYIGAFCIFVKNGNKTPIYHSTYKTLDDAKSVIHSLMYDLEYQS